MEALQMICFRVSQRLSMGGKSGISSDDLFGHGGKACSLSLPSKIKNFDKEKKHANSSQEVKKPENYLTVDVTRI
jgi:hypothetical protein